MSLNSTIKQQFTYQLAPGSLSDNEFHNRHKKCLTFCRIGLWSSFLALAFGKFLSGRHDRKTWSCNNHNSAETNQYLVTYGNHKPHEDTAVKKSKGKLLINYIPPQFAAISPLLQASRIGLWGEVPRAERTNH